MAIPQKTRDKLLVEARHRCTICAEKCFQIHHIIEQTEGGTDDEENLIVLCPNCHLHRYHRNQEFTRDQVRLYKANLKEKNEIERRLLKSIEEFKERIDQASAEELAEQLQEELNGAASLIDPEFSPTVYRTVVDTAKGLANRNELSMGAREAIELQFEIDRRRDKARFSPVEIFQVDKDAIRKSPESPSAYVLELVLNQVPVRQWADVFHEALGVEFYGLVWDIVLDRDRLRMVIDTSASDNLQMYVDYAKRVVARANRYVEEQVIPDLDRRYDSAKARALREYETIQSLKAKTNDLRV